MKNLNRGRSCALGLALIAAGLAAPPALSASAAPTAKPDPSLVAEMRDAASGDLALRENPATGKVGFARVSGADRDLLPGVAAEGRQGAIDKATRYLDNFAGAFGARSNELTQSEVYSDRGGFSVTFTQAYQGVPVFGAELKAEVDREGALTSVNGFAAPGLNLSTSPRFSESEASARALATVKARPDGYQDGGLPKSFTKGLKVRSIELMIYRTGTPRGIAGDNRLAWVAEVWNKGTIREMVVLDAETNKPLNRWTMMNHALDRWLVEAHPDGTYTSAWEEGDAFPDGLDEDQQNEVLGTGESYWMFRNTFGYNSWDGAGGTMITVNNDPRINCPNANWNGFSTNYCTGVTGDDTVAHEWGHAYTESTSGLIYQWQAGAMNEAYSDIWGETVDVLNTRHNEGGDTQADKIERTPGLCSEYTRAEINMEITAPASVDGPCNAAPAGFGPVITQAGVDGTSIVGVDGTGALPDGTPDDSTGNGCLPFVNAGDIAGQWVYVDRGTCTFQTKAQNADDAGALGIVVGDNVAGRDPISMSGAANIYGVMVTLEDGARFKSAGVPVDFHIAAVPANTDNTYRWLSGEADPAFGGAIRDMWNPNCYGHPGAVSDAEYHCDVSDSGGVHSNSGVVNRTFAILVDGYPGIKSIGLDKAAWLFWYTQTHYLTPTSYFPDLADGLEAACASLQGVSFEKVTLGDPSRADGADGGVVEPEKVLGGTTDSDCTAVRRAIKETELRLDPTEQCGFQPLLQPGVPPVNCGPGKHAKTTYREDFEDGLTGWTQDEELGFPFSEGIAWESSEDAPGGRDSTVAFGPDPVAGVCGDVGDLTSRNGLISPDITMPGGSSPRLSFDHYMATEATWDGGNVKVSVNGGPFELIPVDAYRFNAPGGEIDPRQGTSMSGQEAFTGTDGGLLTGSWGTSVIELKDLADKGDTLNFRFDMTRDGCNGVEGWFVDNVTVKTCAPDALATNTTVDAPARVERGRPFTVKVKVTADKAPKGRVVIMKGALRLGRADLNRRGVASITVARVFAIREHTLTAKFLRNEAFRSSSKNFTIKVVPR